MQTAAQTYRTEVVRVTPEAVVIKTEYGEFPVPRQDVINIEIAEPPGYAMAVTALQAGQFAAAIAGFEALATRFGGAEIGWVQDSFLKLAEAHLGAKDFLSAKRTYDRFKKLYQESIAAAGIEVQYVRILVAQGKYDAASVTLSEYVAPLLSKKSITEDEETALSDALVLLGDCQHAQGKADEALDSYLAVVALFDVDPDLTADAKYKSARIFEEQAKPDRARETYQELLNSARAAEAKQRLAALEKARP